MKEASINFHIDWQLTSKMFGMREVCDENHANMGWSRSLKSMSNFTFLGNGKGFQSATYMYRLFVGAKTKE